MNNGYNGMINLHSLDLNLLVVFNEIYQHKQISKVARVLNLSQPAVSNALARLRRNFDDPLFVRTKEGMQATPFADLLADPIRLALNGLSEALNVQEQFNPATSMRHFQIVLTDVAELYFMPRLIQQCALLAPAVRISTRRSAGIDLVAELGEGKTDLAIGAFSQVPQALYQRRLFRQKYVVLMRSAHPLASQKLTLKKMQGAEQLLVASAENPYDQINLALEKADLLGNVKFSVPYFTAVPYIISQSDLLVTVPQKLAASATGHFGLHYHKHPLPLPELQTNIFWHGRYHQDLGNQWLRNLMVEIFSE